MCEPEIQPMVIFLKGGLPTRDGSKSSKSLRLVEFIFASSLLISTLSRVARDRSQGGMLQYDHCCVCGHEVLQFIRGGWPQRIMTHGGTFTLPGDTPLPIPGKGPVPLPVPATIPGKGKSTGKAPLKGVVPGKSLVAVLSLADASMPAKGSAEQRVPGKGQVPASAEMAMPVPVKG